MTPLESFIHEVEETLQKAPDPRTVLDFVSESLRRLLAGSFFLDGPARTPGESTFHATDLYKDPKGRFRIAACAWAPKQASSIHDHPSWGIVAGLSRRVLVTTYRRLDDLSTPGYASLTECARTLVTEASFALLRPPDELIHQIENPYRDAALTLHVLGIEPSPQSTYDPKAKTIIALDEPSALAGI